VGGLEMVLTAAMIATAAGGQLVSGAPDCVIDGFAIDSRSLQSGDLFVAIAAARDGHDFIGDALARGAVGAMVRTGFWSRGLSAGEDARFGPDDVVIEVPETTAALQNLARFVRRESAAKVIAITGSAGKTTTKEAIAEWLSGHYRVTRNKGNLNNHLGLPLSLLELRHGAQVAVMELGMNHAGEIRLLVGIAEPEIRVWTNVGDAHLGHFESQNAIADAKGEILEGASGSDLLMCNADDPLIMERVPRFAGRTVTFGTTPDADVRADSVEDLGLDGMRMRVVTRDGSADLHVPLLGRGNLSNVLAATAVATELGVPLSEIGALSARLKPAIHRGAVLRLANGVTVVDDSYNSSPAALKRALEVMAHEQRANRKAAVLGEMLELGEHSLHLHQDCGRAAANAGLDRLITVGGAAAKALADAAILSGMAASAVTSTASSAVAADLIVRWLEAGDLVLVKGSRGIKTDMVVDRIAADLS
jgi:UDP-N-acetylmuramoyl-tripeptide--D-alanyl-D-alanine ligase